MQKKIGTDDMRKKMGEILDCVNLRGDEFIIERKHQAIAALIPLLKLKALTKVAENYAMELISGKSVDDISQEDVDILINKAKHESRKSHNSKSQK